MEGLSKHNYWSLHVTAFYVSLLATAIRAPCTLIPCVHRLKRSSPAGNRKSPNLLANDDATGFLAFAHSRCNQHQQGKDKQTLIDDGTKTAAAWNMLPSQVWNLWYARVQSAAMCMCRTVWPILFWSSFVHSRLLVGNGFAVMKCLRKWMRIMLSC